MITDLYGSDNRMVMTQRWDHPIIW